MPITLLAATERTSITVLFLGKAAIARNQPALTKVVIDLGEPEFRRQLLKPLVFAGTWRITPCGRSWARRSTCHHDAFKSYLVAVIYTAEIDPVQRRRPDGRFHKSIELGGRAALPDRAGGGWDEVGKTGPHSGLQAAGLAHGPDVPDLRGGSTGKRPYFPKRMEDSPCAATVVGDRGATESLWYTRRLHAPWRF
jgi:hypothetical protein